MPGIWGEGPRGGIFGARIDPRLLQELEKRAALERGRQAQVGAQSGGGGWDKQGPNLARRILAAPSKLFGGLVVDPAVEMATDLATLAGNVYRREQPTMSMDPETGEMHTDPGLIRRTANAAGALTLGAGAIPAEVNALRMGIKAYHGSPHDFERFDASKIGTGEGAQAYGPPSDLPKPAPSAQNAGMPEYPMAPRDRWYGDANYEQTGGQIVQMTPDEFLAQGRPMKVDEVARENIDDLKKHIQDGGELDPLALYKNGKEDGRHRAIAAKELGISSVPVLVWDTAK